MGAFAIGTGERLRFDLAVVKAQFTMGEDGGQAHLRNAIADLGFKDVVVWVARAALPADWPRDVVPLQWPEWPAFAEATWKGQGDTVKDDWGEMRVLHRYAAPSTTPTPQTPSLPPPAPLPPPPPPPVDLPAWDGPEQATATAAAAETRASRAAWGVLGGVVAACAALWVSVTKSDR